ncbi:hypothetical protein D9M69_596650 [compost metagenome]
MRNEVAMRRGLSPRIEFVVLFVDGFEQGVINNFRLGLCKDIVGQYMGFPYFHLTEEHQVFYERLLVPAIAFPEELHFQVTLRRRRTYFPAVILLGGTELTGHQLIALINENVLINIQQAGYLLVEDLPFHRVGDPRDGGHQAFYQFGLFDGIVSGVGQ